MFADGGRDSGGLSGWLAAKALPAGWCAVLVLPGCVLVLVVGYIDVLPFAQKAVANMNINVRASYVHSSAKEEHW